jgi:hypothetical protein
MLEQKWFAKITNNLTFVMLSGGAGWSEERERRAIPSCPIPKGLY